MWKDIPIYTTLSQDQKANLTPRYTGRTENLGFKHKQNNTQEWQSAEAMFQSHKREREEKYSMHKLMRKQQYDFN